MTSGFARLRFDKFKQFIDSGSTNNFSELISNNDSAPGQWKRFPPRTDRFLDSGVRLLCKPLGPGTPLF